MTPDQRAAQIAADQHGVLSTRDLRRAGLSPTQVQDRVDRRGWRRAGRGVVVLPGGPARSWRRDAMTACLLGGPAARASGLTAAALHELCPPPLLPHISVPATSSARTKGGRFHRFAVPLADRCQVDGIPAVTASRAIVEAAALVDGMAVERLVDEAIHAGRASLDSLRRAVERAGPRWAGARRVLTACDELASDIAPGSPAEARFLRRLVHEWGCHGVRPQFEVRDEVGAFVARVDAAVPERRLAFEYDSDRFHGVRRFEGDELRHAKLVALGWRVEHVSKLDLVPTSTRIPALLAALETSSPAA